MFYDFFFVFELGNIVRAEKSRRSTALLELIKPINLDTKLSR
jgi:hypothetical protein